MSVQLPSLPSRLPLPEPALARRTLTDMRDAMRAGLGLARETVDRAPLPAPMLAVAGGVLRRVDRLAQHIDAAASSVAHEIFAAAGLEVDDAAASLSASLAAAVSALGAPELRISTSAVREALAAGAGDGEGPDAAAALMLRLLAAGAVEPAGRIEAAVPVFAALLAGLQMPPADPALAAALAAAIAPEIGAAAGDRAALARLFGEFREHV